MSMNKHVEYTPEGVCARKISFNLEDGKLGYMMGDVYLFPLLGS